MCEVAKNFSKNFKLFVHLLSRDRKTLRNLTTAEGKKFRLGGNARENSDYGSPPPAAAGAHLHSASAMNVAYLRFDKTEFIDNIAG